MAGENFTIQVDITGNGTKSTLDVYPGETNYLIVLDGAEMTTISYELDSFPHWRQIDGNLDQETISAIGDAIENKLA